MLEQTARFTFAVSCFEACCDNLMIYDGTSSDDPLIVEHASCEILAPVETEGSNIYFHVQSDGSVEHDGFSGFLECVPGITI